MSTETFKGARYIPKFYGNWTPDIGYEAIGVVKHNAFTYISKQPVPAGVEITNTDFWLEWADPNAQMEELRQIFMQYVGNVEDLEREFNQLIDSVDKLRGSIYSIDSFSGSTNEEKLFNALDTVTDGVILCGEVSINSQYQAINNKDYRKITIHGATITLNVNQWFNQNNSKYNSVVQFSDCNFIGNDNEIFSSNANAIGAMFRDCQLSNVTVFNSETYYIQSPYFIGCDMNPVENLFTAKIAYDFKMVGCRVESAAGTLVKVIDSVSIRQGSVDNCLIEGRGGVVFDIGGALGFVIENCYFEANTNGLLIQRGTNSPCYITVTKCAFFKPTDAQYAITLNSSAYSFAKIYNNVSNFEVGNLLCNRNFTPQAFVGANNIDYFSNAWQNQGFKPNPNNTYTALSAQKKAAVWNSDDNTWDCVIELGYYEAYSDVHPLELVFAGSFGTSPTYQGFAVIRLTPRTAYNGSSVVLTCDAEIIDSCNSNSMVKQSSVSVDVELSNNAYNAIGGEITVKISGFTSTRGHYKVNDLFGVWASETRKI